jgi:outer membrane protein assembly factor BamB
MTRALLVLLALLAVAAAVGLAVVFWPKPPAPPLPSSGLRLAWVFEASQPGSPIAAPLITPGAVFLAVTHARGFRLSGAVYALDPATGKPRWKFDRDGEMLGTVSSPALAGGRLFLGEGLHANNLCRLHCLDATTGKPRWDFQTGDHIESGPVVADGTVFFAAGNDGVYALDADTGNRKWNFRADLHIDSCPWVEGGRVYVGSGPSRKFPTMQVVCLDASTGSPVWRTPVKLPAWGSPVVAGNRVFVGLGNGRLTQPAQPPETPAGALACFDAATGTELWTVPVGDAVFGRPAVGGDRVVFGSRDGALYGLSFDGKELFRLPMGGPVMASPTAAGDCLYAVSVPGRVVCVHPADGAEVWRYELAQRGRKPEAYAPPRMSGRRLFAAAEMQPGGEGVGVASLFCFEMPE